MSLLLGPILQFRGIHNNHYQLSILVVTDMNHKPSAHLLTPVAMTLEATLLAQVPVENPNQQVWRFDITLTQARLLAKEKKPVAYTYQVDGVSGSFSVPRLGQTPRMAYVSCNGFSDPKLMKGIGEKFGRWQDLALSHQQEAYQLLLMGGDQVYSDEMWQSVPELHDWISLPEEDRLATVWSAQLQTAVSTFFCNLYLKRWAEPSLQALFGAVPSIMMWDDHDIMDGWGSYPQALHCCPVYQGIFRIARDYYRLFQLQLAAGATHPAAIAGQTSFSMGFSGLGKTTLLVPDLRSDRQPTIRVTGQPVQPTQIISASNWNAIYAWLTNQHKHDHLLVLSSVPVAYLDLSLLERMLSLLPGQQELEDDLRDHWRSVPHMQERLRFIQRLVAHARVEHCQVSILSGDVHVGALGIIRAAATGDAPAISVNQLISSGVVHPPAPALVRYVLEQIADKPEAVSDGVTASLERLAGNNHYLIQARNWLALEPDDSGRIWANWHVEGMDHWLTKVL